MQSEVSQKEQNKHHILMHIYEIQKDSTGEPICRAEMETQTQRTDLWTWGWGQERKCGKSGESNMNIHNHM